MLLTEEEREYLEAELGPLKIKAAYLLVEMELNDGSDTEAPKTTQDVADRLGMSRQGLFKWRRESNFIKYKNNIASEFVSDNRAKVYKQLMKLINAPQPSVKAIDIFMKHEGLYENKMTIENKSTGGASESNEDLEKSLQSLQAMKASLGGEGE